MAFMPNGTASRGYSLLVRLSFAVGAPSLWLAAIWYTSMVYYVRCNPGLQSIALPSYIGEAQVIAIFPPTWFVLAAVVLVITTALSYVRRTRATDVLGIIITFGYPAYQVAFLRLAICR